MAGETPDRSGQGKSSGTSSGSSSGERATEAVDPRLAVSGQPAVKGAATYVDQPTAVFSATSPKRKPAGPAASEPVERSDQPTVEPSGSSVPPGAAMGSAASGEEEPQTSASGAASGAVDSEVPEEVDDPKDARLSAAVAARVAGSEGDDDSQPGTDAAPVTDAVPVAAGEAEADAEPEAAVVEAEAGAQDADEASEAPAEDAVEGEQDEQVGSSDEAEAADGAGPVAGAEPEAEPGDEPAVESESESESGAEPESEPEAGFGAASESGSESGSEGEPVAVSDAEPGEDLDPGSEPEPEGKPEPEADADAGSDAERKSDAEAEEPEATPEAGSKPKADGPEAGSKPAPGSKPKAVDQPTAVFKAPRPKVDQPTAMLKLPAEATDADADAGSKAKRGSRVDQAERTSKFVALKPLDEPRTPKGVVPAQLPPEAQPEAGAAGPFGPERTTQQPLPPKPPLDLLAELTNRPKPAETALRTTVRRVKIWTPLALLLVIVFAVVQAVRPLATPTLALTADEKFSFDGSKPNLSWPTEGQAVVDVDGIGSLGAYGDQRPIPIGSVAKVMTAYLILKEHKDDQETLTVDKAAADHFESGERANESVVEVKEGDEITVEEAIQDIMLPSANNIAKLLARWDSNGDEGAFVKKMNAAAKDLGMKNTTYTDASGLDETTVSTAVDQLKLAKAAMRVPLFKEIVRLPKFKSTTSQRAQDQANFNKLVPLFGVVGIKTGSTTKAGGNLLFAAEKEIGGSTQLIIGAVFGQHAPPIIDTATAKSKDLILRTQELLETRTVVRKGDVVGHVDDGLGGTTPVIATKDVSAVGWPGLTVNLAIGDGGKTVPHTAKAGTKVGVLSIGDGAKGAVKVPVALQEDLVEPGFGARLTRIG